MSGQQENLVCRLADFLIRWRWLLFLAALAAIVVAWPIAQHLSLDQSIESLYAEDDIHLLNYRESRQLFGGDEFVLVAYTDPDLFNDENSALSEQGEAAIRQLADRLNQVPGVNAASTQNLADSLEFRFRRSRTRELVRGVLLGADDETTTIVVRLQAGLADEQRAQTIKEIRDIAASRKTRTYVAGEPVQVHDMFRYVQEDGKLLFTVSLGLLACVIIVFFRSVRWVILPLLVVLAAIVWTEAVLVLSGIRLSMVSSMLNSLVTIIGIATVTHVTVRYRECRRTLDRPDALKQTLVDLLPVIFWTCATTAAGFAALLSSDITPIRSFGTMMALGTMLVLLAAATLLPGGILIGTFSPDPKEAHAEKSLIRFLASLTGWIERHPRLLGLVALLLVAFGVTGLFQLEVETDFSKNFRRSSPIIQSLEFVENRLGGAGTWEVNFAVPVAPTKELLDRVRHLAERLRTEINEPGHEELTKVISLSDGYDMVPRIPLIVNTVNKRLRMLVRFHPEFESTLYQRDQGRMRIVLRAREQQESANKLKLINKVQALAREEFPDAKATGLFVLLAYLIENLLRDQLVSFLLAAIGIAAMMTIAFRSLRIGLISLVPNLFPIIVVIGSMGWIGLPINIGTAMIACVSMGLTVDASIHYIAGYRRALARGLSVSDALRETHQQVGRALIFATLALIVGFSVLTLSHFIPLVYFGVLVSASMLGGLVGNLFLLPLLLPYAEKRSSTVAHQNVAADDESKPDSPIEHS